MARLDLDRLTAVQSPRQTVLLWVCALDAAARVALMRAYGLAAAAGWELEVLYALAPDEGGAPRAELALEEWCQRWLPYRLRANQREVRHAELAAQTIAALRERVGLVVLPAAPWASHVAERVARSGAVPVVVARPPRASGTVVGATHLGHPSYPVVSRVAKLSARFDTNPVLVHSMRRSLSDARGTQGPGLVRELSRLRAASAWILPGAELVVTRHERPADGILKVARVLDCDLIVVGASRKGRSRRSVAEEVAARAGRSVLVTPMCEGA